MSESEQINELMDFPTPQEKKLSGEDYSSVDALETVKLFTGEASHSIPLFNYPQVGGLKLDCRLQYNSNIKAKIFAENDEEQASWVGLGWSLEFGRIITEDRKTVSENQRFFLDLHGLEEILCVNGKYFLKQHPRWKIWPQWNETKTGFIDAWFIETDDGIRYEYGGSLNHQSRLLTDGNRVLSAAQLLSSIGYLTYSWELKRISNPHSKPSGTIDFYYWQDKANHPAWLDPISGQWGKYTRASYLDHIVDCSGRVYKFLREDRDVDEYIDPYQESPEPDGYQETFERYRLKEIQIYDHDEGALRRRITFDYDASIGSGMSYKKLLTRISMDDGKSHIFPPYLFSYVPENDPDEPNKSALKEIQYPNGSKITYMYQEQKLRKSLPYIDIGTNRNDIIEIKGNTLVHLKLENENQGKVDMRVFAYYWDGSGWKGNTNSPLEILHAIEVEKINRWKLKLKRKIDTLVQVAGDFFAIRKSRSIIALFYWDYNSKSWNKFKEVFSTDDVNLDFKGMSFYLGNNYAAFLDIGSGSLKWWRWFGNRFLDEPEIDMISFEPSSNEGESPGSVSNFTLYGHPDYFVVLSRAVYGNGFPICGIHRYYSKNGNIGHSWFRFLDETVEFPLNRIRCSDYCLYVFGNIYKWDANGNWIESPPPMSNNMRNQIFRVEEFRDDAVVLTTWIWASGAGGAIKDKYGVGRWNGEKWITQDIGPSSGAAIDYDLAPDADIHVTANNRYCLIAKQLLSRYEIMDFFDGILHRRNPFERLFAVNYDCQIDMYQWNKRSWQHVGHIDNFAVIQHLENGERIPVRITGNVDCFGFHKFALPSTDNFKFEIRRLTETGFVEINEYDLTSPDWFIIRKGYCLRNHYVVKDGKPGIQIFISLKRNNVFMPELLLNQAATNDMATCHSTDNIIITRFFDNEDDNLVERGLSPAGALRAHRLVRDQWQPHEYLNDYPVAKVSYHDGLSLDNDGNPKTIDWGFEYKLGRTDESGNNCSYGKVTTHLPGDAGKVVKHFFNGLFPGRDDDNVNPIEKAKRLRPEYDSPDPDYVLLAGLPYKEESISNRGQLIKEIKYEWEAHPVGDHGRELGFYDKRLARKAVTQDGVETLQEYSYNNEGLISSIAYANGKTEHGCPIIRRCEKFIYAYEDIEHSQNMRGYLIKNNILKRISQQTVKGIPLQDNGTNANIAYSHTWIGWSEDGSSIESLARWLSQPSNQYDIPETPRPGDPQKIFRYDANGNLSEIEDAEGRIISFKWGYRDYYGVRPGLESYYCTNNLIGIFKNAKADESFVCDFEDGLSEWIFTDGVSLERKAAFTGRRGLRLERQENINPGIKRRFSGLEVGKSYIIEAKIKGRGAIFTIEGDEILGIKKEVVSIDRGLPGVRFQARRYVESIFVSGSEQWKTYRSIFTARSSDVWLNIYMNQKSQDSIVFCDHIRFYPEDALARTQTVDPFTGNVLATFDENHVATLFFYDTFGRLLEVRNEENALISAYHYHYQRERVPLNNFRLGKNIKNDWIVMDDAIFTTGEKQEETKGKFDCILDIKDSIYELNLIVEHIRGPEDFGLLIGDKRILRRKGAWFIGSGKQKTEVKASYLKNWRIKIDAEKIEFHNGDRQILSSSNSKRKARRLSIFTNSSKTLLKIGAVYKLVRSNPNYIEQALFPGGNLLGDWSFEDEPYDIPSNISISKWELTGTMTNPSPFIRRLSYSHDSYFGDLSLRLDVEQGKKISTAVQQSFYAYGGKRYWVTAWFKAPQTAKARLQLGSENCFIEKQGNDAWQKMTVCLDAVLSGDVIVKLCATRVRNGVAYVLFDGAVVEQSLEQHGAMVTRVYGDGIGRVFQVQGLAPSTSGKDYHDTSISYRTYNKQGLVERIYKTISDSFSDKGIISAPLDFLPGFQQYCLDFYNDESISGIPDDIEPYSQLNYYRDPLSRLRTFRPEGIFFHEDGHENNEDWEHYYTVYRCTKGQENDAVKFIDSRFLPEGYYRKELKNPNGMVSLLWHDDFGNLAGWSVDPASGLTGGDKKNDNEKQNLYLTTLLRRDPLGRIVEQIPPKAFDGEDYTQQKQTLNPLKREHYSRFFRYDTLGRTIERKDPDQGKSFFVYDKSGVLRYFQDENMLLCNRPHINDQLPMMNSNIRQVGIFADWGETKRDGFEFIIGGSDGELDCNLTLLVNNRYRFDHSGNPRPYKLSAWLFIFQEHQRRPILEKEILTLNNNGTEYSIIFREIIPISCQTNKCRIRVELRNEGNNNVFAQGRLNGTIEVTLNTGYQQPRFKVLSYDKLGRLETVALEEGDYLFAYRQPAIDGAFGLEQENHTLKLFYDKKYIHHDQANYSRGRITKIEQYIKRTQNTEIVKETYLYNRQGLVTCRQIHLPGLSSSEQPKQIFYEWNELGKLTKRSIEPDRLFTWYKYDIQGRLIKVLTHTNDVEEDAETIVTYEYWQDGRLKKATLGESAQTVDYKYNIRGWPTLIKSEAFETALGYHEKLNPGFPGEQKADLLGNINWITWKHSPSGKQRACQYIHDHRQQLLSETDYIMINNGWSKEGFSEFDYDPNGNIKELVQAYENHKQGFKFGYLANHPNQAHWLEYNHESRIDLLYDLNGNLRKDPTRGEMTITYDERDFPICMVSKSKKLKLELIYDFLGRLVKHSSSKTGSDIPGNWHMVRDFNGNVLAAYHNGVLQYWNLHGLGLIGRKHVQYLDPEQKNKNLINYFYLKDHLGSVRTVIDNRGNVKKRFDYFPYGAVKEESGENTPLLFERHANQPYDKKQNLAYFGVRIYDPLLGRWMRPEPLSDLFPDVSPYAFVKNNPMRLIDPIGLQEEKPVGSIDGEDIYARETEEGGIDFFYKVAPDEVEKEKNVDENVNWKTLYDDWRWGAGEEYREFGPSSHLTKDMMDAPGVREARIYWYEKNLGKLSSFGPLRVSKYPKNLEPVTNFRGSFGWSEFKEATINLDMTEHFVGSFRVDIYPNPDYTITFVVSNTTSMTSYMAYLTKPFGFEYPSHPRSYMRFCGNMCQTFSWTEPIFSPDLYQP